VAVLGEVVDFNPHFLQFISEKNEKVKKYIIEVGPHMSQLS